jgi:hypothetical protein
MPPPTIVELEIICKPMPGLGNRDIGLQMYIFVLQGDATGSDLFIALQKCRDWIG